MKLSNQIMFDSILILRSLHETGKLGYACARNLRKLTDESKEFFDAREGILKKYGTINEEGNYAISKDVINDYNKELSEYASIEHEVDVYQIDEETFCSGTIDSQQMYTLDWMVKAE